MKWKELYDFKSFHSGKQILLKTDNPAWKEFSMKPSIKYILRALAGLAANHPTTQVTNNYTLLHLIDWQGGGFQTLSYGVFFSDFHV